MGEYGRAKELAENIRKSKLFGSLTLEEQHVFSVYEAEAKVYAGEIEAGLRMLEKAEEALKPKEMTETASYEGRQKVQAYIRALNDIGYIGARRFDYWEAAKSYGEALSGYEGLVLPGRREEGRQNWEAKVSEVEKSYGRSILSDWADTLKNLSFAYSKLGFHRAAYLLSSESNRLYHQVKNDYGKGLVASTQGAIFIEREWYCNARRVLESALRVFQKGGSVPDERGEALVLLSLGQAYRKLVDMENIQGRKEDFESYFQSSKKALESARKIIEGKEPSRRAEVYQALGCLYRDWMAFAVRGGKEKETYRKYEDMAKSWFDKAKEVAESKLQDADICVDLADWRYHCCYRAGYGVKLIEWAKRDLEGYLKKAENLVPKQFLYPYRPPYPSEELKNTLWWKIMGKIHLLKGHVAFKEGNFKGADEEYLESFLFFDLYSEEAALFSVASRSGRRLYSKFSRIPKGDLVEMENLLMEKGAKRRILDRQGWRSLLNLVRDARLHAEPYVL